MLHLRITPLRDPFCGLLLPSIFPSKGDKEADESSLTAQVKAIIIFILKSFPDAQKSPYHPSSRSFEELQTLRFPRDRFWPSAFVSDAFSATQQRFAHRIKDGRVWHTLLQTLNKFGKASNSPTQGSELKTILIFWIYFGTGFRILIMCLWLSGKLLPWNNRLRRTSSPTTFSPSRWWPRFVPFTRRSFCPWMIQLSPSCRSPFPRPVAVWLRALPSNAPFVTLKRRQLVCGVCLLCDSWLVLF